MVMFGCSLAQLQQQPLLWQSCQFLGFHSHLKLESLSAFWTWPEKQSWHHNLNITQREVYVNQMIKSLLQTTIARESVAMSAPRRNSLVAPFLSFSLDSQIIFHSAKQCSIIFTDCQHCRVFNNFDISFIIFTQPICLAAVASLAPTPRGTPHRALWVGQWSVAWLVSWFAAQWHKFSDSIKAST